MFIRNLTDFKKLKQCGAPVVDLIDVAWLSKVKVIAKDKIERMEVAFIARDL